MEAGWFHSGALEFEENLILVRLTRGFFASGDLAVIHSDVCPGDSLPTDFLLPADFLKKGIQALAPSSLQFCFLKETRFIQLFIPPHILVLTPQFSDVTGLVLGGMTG